MSTPLPEQTVPEEFQDIIDLPQAGQVDQDELDRLNGKIADYNRQLAAYGNDLEHARSAPYASDWRHRFGTRAKEDIARVKDLRAQARLKISGTTGDFGEYLHGEDRDAYESLKSLFASYGLGSLAPKIFDYVKEGYGADTIALLLQDTKEYKERFAANEARRKAGLPVLSPSEYLSVESSYRQILSSAGLPKGFYDNNADFRKWIADDVSPSEIKDRVDLATAATSQSNPEYRAALEQMYGISGSDLTAYFLDRSKAEPILKKQAAAAAIGAAALRHGFGVDSKGMEAFATAGVTGQQAEQAYGRISEGLDAMLGIAGRFGSTWSFAQAQGAEFGFGGETKRKRLASQERALFAGSSGASAAGLSGGFRQT